MPNPDGLDALMCRCGGWKDVELTYLVMSGRASMTKCMWLVCAHPENIYKPLSFEVFYLGCVCILLL